MKQINVSFFNFYRYYGLASMNKITMRNELFKVYSLSPTGSIGSWVLFIGLIFTGIMFYFVFFRLNRDDDSFKDRKRRTLENEKQKERIAKLYPK